MLEGYFVRTLGMHRVYNSAFMHMLRDENNAGYRRLMKETLEFDPEILKRYVNFMNNPDEKTALEQFGKGDKYFGVATLMATLPGLPMLGHGQVEGFAEKYGMEFRRATLDERPDEWLVERHEREIFPLLHRRGQFAEARDFLLYDFVAGDGSIDENVFAYSNGSGPSRSLVIYHNRYGSTAGRIRASAAYAVKQHDGSKELTHRTLADGLGLRDADGAFISFRDARTGLEYLRSAAELRAQGLSLSLDAYQCHVFWEFRELQDGATGQWSRLAALLDGRGVPSLEGALRELQLEPVHEPVRAFFRAGVAGRVAAGDATAEDIDALREQHVAFLRAVATATGVSGDPEAIAASVADRVRALFGRNATDAALFDDRASRATVLAWLLLSRMGELAPGADVAGTSRAWYDELRLAPVLAQGLRDTGIDEGGAWETAGLVRALLDLPTPSTIGRPAATLDARLLEAWLARDHLRAAMGVNTWEGTEWLDGDRFAALLAWAERLDTLAGAAPRGSAKRLNAAAEKAGYRLNALRKALAPARKRPSAPIVPAARRAAGPSGSGRPVRRPASRPPRDSH
jgi:hypothetical protein